MDLLFTSFINVFHWQNVMLMLLGTLIGVVVGILPGIGASQAMALMIPLTWKMEAAPAFTLLVSIYATSLFVKDKKISSRLLVVSTNEITLTP